MVGLKVARLGESRVKYERMTKSAYHEIIPESIVISGLALACFAHVCLLDLKAARRENDGEREPKPAKRG